MENKNLKIKYQLKYSITVKKEMLSLIKKYNLEVDQNLNLAERIKKENPRVFIFKTARKILNKEGSFKDIIESLKNGLEMKQKDAESLANEVKDKILPMAEEIVEEEEEIEEEIPIAVEEKKLDRSVREKIFPLGKEAGAIKPKEEPLAPPFVKKPVIRDVEEMAKMRQAEKKFVRPDPSFAKATEGQVPSSKDAGEKESSLAKASEDKEIEKQPPQTPQAQPKTEEPVQNPSGIEAGRKPKEDTYRETVE